MKILCTKMKGTKVKIDCLSNSTLKLKYTLLQIGVLSFALSYSIHGKCEAI